MPDVGAECATGAEAFGRIQKRARAERLPVTASLALTHRCNLRCVHCYARGDVSAECSATEWVGMIDQLADAGCLFLLLTGGEPLLRPDFSLIYRHACERGLIVTVFTNATLVSESIISLFRDLPPRIVDVSLYGLSAETYGRVTGSAEAMDRCWQGVRALHDAGIRIGLKTVVLRSNRHELAAMQEAARALGVRFRLDVGVFPGYGGARSPLDERLTPAEAAELELGDAGRAADWAALYDRHRHEFGPGPLYRCGAGLTHAHVDPRGTLHPCLMAAHVEAPLVGRGFGPAWAEIGASLSDRRTPNDSACLTCDKHVLCGYCPGFNHLESGDEALACAFQCELGQERYRRLARGRDVVS